jgi:drug/metabolite transporter (DMT)-like permease
MSSDNSRVAARLGYLAVVSASVLFSAKGVIIKICYQHGIEPVALMALRMLFSLPFFLGMAVIPWFIGRGKPSEPLVRGEMLAIAGLGLLGYYLASLFDLLGLQYVSAGLERLILFMYPTLVVMLSALIFRKRVGREMLLPLILSYGGMALSFGGEASGAPGSGRYLGGFLIFLSALCYALFLVGQGRMVHRIGPQRLTAYSMLASSLAAFIHFACFYPLSSLAQPVLVYVLALVMAVFCTVVPAFLLGYGIKAVGAGRAAVISTVGPVSTLILAAWFLGEPAGFLQAAGLALVIAGGWKLGLAKS